MTSAVTFTGTNPVTDPSVAKKIIAVSSNTSDTPHVTAVGLVSGTGSSDTLTLLSGRREVATSGSFTTLSFAGLDADPAGSVTLREEGSAAIGYVFSGGANPADGETISLGLTGYAQTYTFRAYAKLSIQCLAQGAAGFATGDYFDITDASGAVHRFWYNINSGGGAPSTPVGGTLTSIAVATGDNAAFVAAATTNAIAFAMTNCTATNSSNVVTVLQDRVLGTLSVTDGAGSHATGFTFTTLATGTANAANQIGIGADVSATLDNLRRAINDAGTEGVNYGTGTTGHAFLTATTSGATLTLTDQIKCARVLTWDCSTPSTALTVVTPTGGTNGARLATLASGLRAAYNTLNFDNETLALETLPALFKDVWSDPMRISGGYFTIESLLASGSDLTFALQTSTDDGVTWRDLDTFTLSAGSLSREVFQTNVEMARISLTTNSNILALPLHMKVVS